MTKGTPRTMIPTPMKQRNRNDQKTPLEKAIAAIPKKKSRAKP